MLMNNKSSHLSTNVYSLIVRDMLEMFQLWTSDKNNQKLINTL